MAGVSISAPSKGGAGGTILFDDDADSTVVKDIDVGRTALLVAHLASANAAKVFLSLWNKRTPTGGSDAQDYQFPVPASLNKTLIFERGGNFTAGLSYMVTTGKGTGASGNPATPPDLYLFTTSGELRAPPAALVAPPDPSAAGPITSDIQAIYTAKRRFDPSMDNTKRLMQGSAFNIYGFLLDNRGGAADLFWKGYDVAAEGSVTLGTTDPDIVIRIPAGQEARIIVPEGIVLSNGLVYVAVTTGGTAGSTGPTGTKPSLELISS